VATGGGGDVTYSSPATDGFKAIMVQSEPSGGTTPTGWQAEYTVSAPLTGTMTVQAFVVCSP
jgi:hypothetical protein